ncbi:carboxyltransferase domain-containing protein [Rhodococcus sp. 3Y1]
MVRLHSAAPLVMRCYGSPGGAPMLDGPAFGLPIPRRSSPRPHVAAGSVAVAGRQAVVSARPAPGGWAVIGRTPLILVDPASEQISPTARAICSSSVRSTPIAGTTSTDARSRP